MNFTTRLLLILFIMIAASVDAQAGEINWITDLEEAKTKALSENKLILADFWADWCPPCREMETHRLGAGVDEPVRP